MSNQHNRRTPLPADRPATEPRTEAGRAYLAELNGDTTPPEEWRDAPGYLPRASRRAWEHDRDMILAIEAEAAQGAAPHDLDCYGKTGLSTCRCSEGAAPRAEGLDVERIRSMAIYVEKYDRDMVPLDDVLAVLDNFVPADIDADGQARAILARLSRPSDERIPCLCGADENPNGPRLDIVCPKHDGELGVPESEERCA